MRALQWGGALLAINAFVASIIQRSSSTPLTIMYTILLVHTMGAIPFFSPMVTLNDIVLQRLNVVIAIIFVLLGWSLNNASHFFVLMALLFFLAAIAYMRLSSLTFRKKFHQKIYIDGLGGILAVAALVSLQRIPLSIIGPILAVLYGCVTIWMLWVRPYYRVN